MLYAKCCATKRFCNSLISFLPFVLVILICTVGFTRGASAAAEVAGGATINSDGFGILATWDNALSKDITVGSNVTVAVSSTDIAVGRLGAGLYASADSRSRSASIDVADNLKVRADGDNVRGVAAIGTGGVINIGKSADITTSGVDGYGVEALSGSNIKFTDAANISTSGRKAYGAYADSATIDLGDNATVTTSGTSAFGIFSEYAALITAGDNVSISTSGESATAVRALFGGKVEIGDNASITAFYKESHGIIASAGSYVKIGNGAVIKISSQDSVGAYAFKSEIEIGDGAVIETFGDRSSATFVQNLAKVRIGDGAVITTSGLHSYGALALLSSDVRIGSDANITTLGDNAYGVSSYHHSYIDVGDSLTITTSGKNAHGIYTNYESSMDVGSSAVITTLSHDAHGIFVNDNASMTIGDSAYITTTGDGSHGVYVNDKSSIQMDGATISATGAGSYAMLTDIDSQIIGRGVFNIIGDIYAGAGSSIDLTLAEGSVFKGAADIQASGSGTPLSLAMEKSRWDITGNSHLSSLLLGETTVDFKQSPAFTTLTIEKLNSSVSGTGGTFIMKADIPSLSSDRIMVTDSSSSGFYNIKVLNVGRAPASGDEILTLAESVFGSTVSFDLTSVVEYGGWQYGMNYVQGVAAASGVSGINNAWQLMGTGRASTPGSGAVNSFAGSYLMAYADTQTLIQRMGDLRQSPYGNGLWFRVHGGKFESNAKSYVRGFDMDYGGVQIGYDREIDNNWDGALYVGAMFGYGKGELDYHREGSGEVDSKTLGVYGTYIGESGFYIDAVLKYQWMTNDFDVIDTDGIQVRGRDVDTGGIGASVEFGQRLRVGNGGGHNTGWYVEPQVQLSYQRQDGGYFNATNGLNIGVEPFTSILGRAGMQVGYETEKSNFYAKVSKVKEFDGDLNIRANGVPICESFASSWWVYGMGYTSRINDRNSLYLDIERTSGGSFRQPWRIFAGWRVEF